MKQDEKKNKKRKILLVGFGTTALGVLGLLGWQYWRNRKARTAGDAGGDVVTYPPVSSNTYLPASTNTTTTTASRNDNFPLQRGSKGTRVKNLQLALISKYGSSILPKYGADGDFGNETATALTTAGLPGVIDESTYNVLVKGSGINPYEVAGVLYKAAVGRNITQVLSTLKGMNTVDDYSAVSTAFQNYYRIDGVRKTLVNGLLDSFSSETDKQKIRLEFSRMGLQYNGTQWSLSGLPSTRQIITVKPAAVYKAAGVQPMVSVPTQVVLGRMESHQRGWTYFFPLGSGELLRVPTHSIKSFNP